ncbi:MAG: glycine--tRNA ligase [Planctomycetota bacterium]|nr:glycine--tRNA ligase [Planctomycetota bacterium]MDA1106007.1 glycine--tRNA ligase [Planctomycetota bacterium]
MSDTNAPATRSMDAIVSLCRRRGFIFQSSEIYGGINGFWDYGPLGTALKRNLKNAWWNDIVDRELLGPDGQPVDIVGVDCTIIMNPKTWVASGHVGGFNDPMVDCKESKARYRADHLACICLNGQTEGGQIYAYVTGDDDSLARARKALDKYIKRTLEDAEVGTCPFSALSAAERAITVGPDAKAPGSLTEPRMFNLMFETHCGAIRDADSLAYLRPETAQGIFANFWNIVDTSRVKVPFGIAQVGKAFRNEVTPRNFTFRSREFEQMEIEFFIRPDSANEWYAWWRNQRFAWWQSIGLAGENLLLREHDKDELAHYAKTGAGTSDIEYRFPFTAPGFGELEGVAHRADFDLKAHATHCGKGDKMRYFDQERNERYFPHVIEPSAGADRGTLALLCEAYTPDPARPSGVYMKFHPRMAPIKAAVYPLVNKEGMPEIAESLYRELRREWSVEFDEKQSIGKRYARMDEAGTPFCFTVDGESANDQTVTVRHRDSLQQERIGIGQVKEWLRARLG